MKKAIRILSIAVLMACFCTEAYAAVEPMISVNGMTGNVNVASDTPVSLNVKLSPGEKDGVEADWWILCEAFGKWYYYNLDGKWTDIGESPDVSQFLPTYQGKLFKLQPTDLLQGLKLSAGKYTLYFGVDSQMNGKADMDSMTFKAVSLTVNESGKLSDFITAGQSNLALYSETAAPTVADAGAKDASEVQRAIEEADIIKAEGSYLYLLNQYKGLTICDISTPDSPFIAGRAAITGDPIDMYIRDTRAYIIVSEAYQAVYRLVGDVTTQSSADAGSRIQVVDISDKANPKLSGEFTLKGRVTDSRIVGNILYVVSSEEPYYYWYGYAEKSETTAENTRNIYAAAIDISDPANIREADREDFGGTARYIHVTDQAIFIASGTEYYGNTNTTITYLDIADPAGKMTKRGSIDVAGSVNDKFKMDFYNGYFRVCTYQWGAEWSRKGISNLFVIDAKTPDQLKQVGSVKLGEGEQLFATRFDGNRAYMVTYEMKDPLWVIDLSDPANPTIKGELVVPGWSTHIEPKGDRLIALGVDDTDGWKVSISLFDVSDPQKPGLIERVSFGDKDNGWSSSAAYSDVKALTVLDEMGLILLPYTMSSYTDGRYTTENRLQLIDYSASDLNVRGWVSQKGDVLRSRSVSNRLFSVSADELQVIDASNRDNPKVTARLTLALNITDFIPLGNNYGVQVIEHDGKYTLRAVPLSDPENGKAVSETAFDTTSYSGAFVNGNLIYLVSNEYNYRYMADMAYYPYGTCRIQVMDFSAPASPVKRGTIDLEGNYYGLLRGAISIYPNYNSGQILQMNGSKLIFPYSSGYYGPILYAAEDTGDASPVPPIKPEEYKAQSSIRIIDLADADHPKQLSELKLDIAGGSGYFLNGSILYFSYAAYTETDVKERPLSKYYLGRIDLSDTSKPVQLASVNIPGTCIGTDSSGKYLFTINTEWSNTDDWSQSYTFNALKLENDKALLTGHKALKSYAGKAVIADGYAYLSGNGITVVDISNPEKLNLYENSITDTWTDILDVKNRKIFANISGGIACYDASDPAKLTLKGSVSHYGYNHIAYSGSNAYIPMGYYGVWVKSLD